MRVLGYIAISVSVAFIGGLSWIGLTNRGTIYEYVNSGWNVKYGEQEFPGKTLPFVLDEYSERAPNQKATFRRVVDIPATCAETPCYLFLGEIGDLVKASVEGRQVRAQGYSADKTTTAKHYPFWMEIPRYRHGQLDLSLEVETKYGVGFGILRGPFFIGDYTAVRAYERFMFFQTVVLPFMQALLLSILGLIFLASWKIAKLGETYFRFGVYAIVACAFMVSFSFIPREYLSVSSASFLHFGLRLLMDWTFFEIVGSLVPIGKRLRILCRTILAVGLVGLGYSWLISADYYFFVKVVRFVSPVIVGIPLAGFISALSLNRINRRSPAPHEMDLLFLIPTFGLLTLFQLRDTLIFWGVGTGSYLVKLYPAPLAFVIVIVLVRRLVRAHEEFARSKVESERDALVGRIAIEFSHDLKSPLNSLKDCAELAIESGDSEYQQKVLSDVARRTTDVTRRLQELLEYSREEIRERRPARIEEITSEVVDSILPRAKVKNIRLVTAVDALNINVDKSSFKRALQNILDNAIDASPENAQVTLKVNSVRGRVQISVQDSGKGIEKSDIQRIFDPYFTKGKEGGTGLGLAIVDRIVRQHGGSVKVFSKVAEGTIFVMEVPQ